MIWRSVALLAVAVASACGDPAAPLPPPRQAPVHVDAPPAQGDAAPVRDDAAPVRDDAPPVRDDGTIYAAAELMGTRVSLNVWLPPDRSATQAGAAMQRALVEMAHVEDAMSEWRPDSELSRVSRASGGEPVVVGEALATVLSRAKTIAAQTDGAFDPTFHGVGQLWSFAAGAVPPSAAAIAAKLPLVDYRALEVDVAARTARLTKPGMMLGLGAIAKGYAVDRASAVLVELGFADHVVEAGGDTYAAGTKGGTPWAVGIQHPGRRGVVGILPSSDQAIVTSGNYQRFFEHEGTRYAHILDPTTGWPIPEAKSPKSVTVVAANTTDADAFATAVAVLGVQAGLAFVEGHPGLEAVVIDRDDDVHITSGLKEVLISPDPRPLSAAP